MTRTLTLVCAAVLLTGVAGQQTTTPPLPQPPPVIVPELSPEEIAARRERDRMAQEYIWGDAEAAVAYFAGRKTDSPGGSPDTQPSSSPGLAGVLFSTEVGMRLRTFGKYARSARLEAGKDMVGLNGDFEINSFLSYRSLDDLLHLVRHEVVPRDRDLRPRSLGTTQPMPSSVPSLDRRVVEKFARDWHVVTISYCMRWELNCADTLLASAKERFPGSADVLVVEAAIAEAQDSSSALALLRRAVRADPNNVAAQLRLGRLLLAQGRPTEAQPALERALTLARAAHHDASRALALESLAEIDRRAGRTTRARERAAEAASLTPFASPLFAGLSQADIYGAGQFYEQPRRLAALRDLVRPPGPR